MYMGWFIYVQFLKEKTKTEVTFDVLLFLAIQEIKKKKKKEKRSNHHLQFANIQ